MPEVQQTIPAGLPRLSDRVAIGVLTRTYPPALVDQVLTVCGRVERRHRLLPARLVVYYVLALALFAGVAYEEVLRCLVETLRGRRGGPTRARPGGPGASRPNPRWSRPAPGWARHRCGCCSSRPPSRWPPSTPQERGIAACGCWRSTGAAWMWPTHPPMRPRSVGRAPAVVKAWERSRRCGWSPWPSAAPTHHQGRDRALHHRGDHPGPAGARAAGAGDADPGRPGLLAVELWRQACSTGAALLWRAKTGTTGHALPVDQELADGSWLSRLDAGGHRRRDPRGPIVVRVLDYSLEDPGRPGHRQRYRLVTSILDPAEAPAGELAALYHQRWELEGALDELKTHQRGPGRCCAPRPPKAWSRRCTPTCWSTTPSAP
jgi:Insertion element 4 transposase N-terminal